MYIHLNFHNLIPKCASLQRFPLQSKLVSLEKKVYVSLQNDFFYRAARIRSRNLRRTGSCEGLSRGIFSVREFMLQLYHKVVELRIYVVAALHSYKQ
jgi:hypothetical protein